MNKTIQFYQSGISANGPSKDHHNTAMGRHFSTTMNSSLWWIMTGHQGATPPADVWESDCDCTFIAWRITSVYSSLSLVSSFHEIKTLFHVNSGPFRVKETLKQVKLTEVQLQCVTAFSLWWSRFHSEPNFPWFFIVSSIFRLILMRHRSNIFVSFRYRNTETACSSMANPKRRDYHMAPQCLATVPKMTGFKQQPNAGVPKIENM